MVTQGLRAAGTAQRNGFTTARSRILESPIPSSPGAPASTDPLPSPTWPDAPAPETPRAPPAPDSPPRPPPPPSAVASNPRRPPAPPSPPSPPAKLQTPAPSSPPLQSACATPDTTA